ncbi:MAG: hypothetical protein IJ361_05165 [Spirochaetaceae bacterium]|nr:hypothetical protein [Spirochaetaceae bacterium]
MKYCSGKYHGDIKKQIEDNENYCLLCCGRIANEKEEKKKGKKTVLRNICEGVVGIAAISASVLSVVNLVKGKDES